MANSDRHDDRRDEHELSLILGGARSGKSRFGEGLIARHAPPWIYIATAQAFDDEMAERIAEHIARRGPDWRTVEAPLELAAAIDENRGAGRAVLVDCLTLWLGNLMLAGRPVETEAGRLIAALSASRDAGQRIVLVSNEVGLGIVPDNALARRFRDAQGRLNQQVAAIADRVVLMAAGLPMVLK